MFLHSDSRENGYGEKRYLAKDFQSIFLTLSSRFFSLRTKAKLHTHQVGLVVKNGPSDAGDMRHSRRRFDPWVRKTPWRRKWQPILVSLPGESTWKEELGGLQSRRSQSQTQRKQLSTHKHTHIHWNTILCAGISRMNVVFTY